MIKNTLLSPPPKILFLIKKKASLEAFFLTLIYMLIILKVNFYTTMRYATLCKDYSFIINNIMHLHAHHDMI